MRNKFLTMLLACGLAGQVLGSEYRIEARRGATNPDRASILVRSGAITGPNGFYFNPGSREKLCLKLGSEIYEILNLELNGENFVFSRVNFSGTNDIITSIHSADNALTPPSLIAKKGDQYYLLYVRPKVSRDIFTIKVKDKEYGFDLIELNQDNLTFFYGKSQNLTGFGNLVTLGDKKYNVRYVQETEACKYLLMTPV